MSQRFCILIKTDLKYFRRVNLTIRNCPNVWRDLTMILTWTIPFWKSFATLSAANRSTEVGAMASTQTVTLTSNGVRKAAQGTRVPVPMSEGSRSPSRKRRPSPISLCLRRATSPCTLHCTHTLRCGSFRGVNFSFYAHVHVIAAVSYSAQHSQPIFSLPLLRVSWFFELIIVQAVSNRTIFSGDSWHICAIYCIGSS